MLGSLRTRQEYTLKYTHICICMHVCMREREKVCISTAHQIKQKQSCTSWDSTNIITSEPNSSPNIIESSPIFLFYWEVRESCTLVAHNTLFVFILMLFCYNANSLMVYSCQILLDFQSSTNILVHRPADGPDPAPDMDLQMVLALLQGHIFYRLLQELQSKLGDVQINLYDT